MMAASTLDSRQSTCSIARTLAIIGDRWSLLILREAHSGTTRFADFREVLGIAPDVLSARLSALVEHGILVKRPYRAPGERSRDAYYLTHRGADLKTVLGALQQWGDEHVPTDATPTVRRRRRSDGQSLDVAFVDGAGRSVDPDEVFFEHTADRRVRRTSHPSEGSMPATSAGPVSPGPH